MKESNQLKAGWLNKQFERTAEDVKRWPQWMRREAGFEDSKLNTSTEKEYWNENDT